MCQSENMEFITFIVVLVCLQDSVGSFVIEKYVHEGKEVNITCPIKVAIANLTWRGPPELKLYATRTTASNIQNIQVIHVGSTKENILKILKFNAKNEGLYQCTSLYGGEITFKVTILRTPKVSIVDEFNTRDETLNLSCIASGGVPDNYTYEWEHRTDADHHIRFLTSTPFITVRNNSIQSNGAYVCRVFNAYSFGSSKKIDTQFAVYNLTISAVPHFVFNNTKEIYVYINRTTKLKVRFVANPAANTILLMDNKPALELKSTDIINSVQNATVVDYYDDEAVVVNGYEIKLWICIRERLDFNNITIVLQNDRGSNNYTIQLKTARQTGAPGNIRAVALDDMILVKWTADFSINLHQTFFVEYRKHSESSWSRVFVEEKSTLVLNGLDQDTIYLLRMYSETMYGKSNKTDDILIKTVTQVSKIHMLTTKFALILGAVMLMTFLCWCGFKALRNRKYFCRNKDSRGSSSHRNEETSTRQAHYDEINSMYYNPMNDTISHQVTRNNHQLEIRQPLDANLENNEANSSSSQIIPLCTLNQFQLNKKSNSSRSSSDESYLVPCRNYIDFDIEMVNGIEPHQDLDTEEPEIIVHESSISSNSETNIKNIRIYETLNVSDINEHCYQKYNEIDV